MRKKEKNFRRREVEVRVGIFFGNGEKREEGSKILEREGGKRGGMGDYDFMEY
jgi:hypothetical protein